MVGEDRGPAGEAVDDGAPEERNHEQRGADDRAPEPELGRAPAEREDLERERDPVHEVADHGYGLARPQEPEVTMAQRLDDPRQGHAAKEPARLRPAGEPGGWRATG